MDAVTIEGLAVLTGEGIDDPAVCFTVRCVAGRYKVLTHEVPGEGWQCWMQTEDGDYVPGSGDWFQSREDAIVSTILVALDNVPGAST